MCSLLHIRTCSDTRMSFSTAEDASGVLYHSPGFHGPRDKRPYWNNMVKDYG